MPRWPDLQEAAPRIEALRWIARGGVDTGDEALACPVLLLGDQSAAALEELARDLDKEVVWTEDGFYYYKLALNPVKGHPFALHVYAPFGSELKGFLAHTRWVVIASRGPNRDPSWPKWVDRLTRILVGRDEVAVALLGDSWMVNGWKISGGRTPIASGEDLQAVLKAVARDFLQRLKELA